MTLDREMRAVLLRLELLPFGAVQAWNKSGGHDGEPDDRSVAQVLRLRDPLNRPPHLHYRELYQRQQTDAGRRAVILEANELHAHFVKRADPPPDTQGDSGGELEDWVLNDGEGWSPEAVAQHFNIHAAFVRRIRERHNRGTEDGRRVDGTVDNPAERARELRARGLTTRQIALTIGVSQTSVVNWTRGVPASSDS